MIGKYCNIIWQWFLVWQHALMCTLNSLWILQVLVEPLSTTQCVCELVQLAHGQVALHSILAQNEAVYLALDKSRDLVLVTDSLHIIQVMLVIKQILILNFNVFNTFTFTFNNCLSYDKIRMCAESCYKTQLSFSFFFILLICLKQLLQSYANLHSMPIKILL